MWLIILTAVAAVLIYLKIVRPYNYWEKKGIPFVKPVPFFGNMAQNAFQRLSFGHMVDEFYKAFPDKRYVGIYQFLQPTLLLRDLELIKKITIKEFNTFPDHRTFSSRADPLWSRNLVALTVKDGWHDMRATLSPSFTSGKMKLMFVLMQQCATQLVNYFEKQEGLVDVELKDALSRYTIDVIGTTAFGVTCDSLKDRNNEFYLMGKDAADFTGLRALKLFAYTISPFLMELFKVSIFSKQVAVFFRKLIKETLRIREEKQIVRPDMIHLLMEARKGSLKYEDGDLIESEFSVVQESVLGLIQKPQKSQITDDDITAQALIFFLGGFESSSTVMCHTAYELALNPDIQGKLREEICATLEARKNQITYEALLSMKYLDCVISETLRKWPVSPILDRYSVKPFTIEPELPGEKALHIEAGTMCWIPVCAIHRDPKYYCNPDKFNPARFSDENKQNIKPFTYMPFGSGPRNCIGSRFALLESKLIIVEILRKFEIVPTNKTQIPLVLSKKNFMPVPDDGFWLGLKPLTTSR